MLNFVRNQLIIPEKWGFEPGGEYANPTFKLTNRRKTQKDRGLQIRFINREQNCSRRRLFTNCTPPYLIMLGQRIFPVGGREYQEYSVASLNIKNLMSPTPRNCVLNALILALKDSAEAFVSRRSK